jgi:hypothetical protein
MLNEYPEVIASVAKDATYTHRCFGEVMQAVKKHAGSKLYKGISVPPNGGETKS